MVSVSVSQRIPNTLVSGSLSWIFSDLARSVKTLLLDAHDLRLNPAFSKKSLLAVKKLRTISSLGRLEIMLSTYRSLSSMSVMEHLFESKCFIMTAFKMKGEQVVPSKTDLKQ